MVLEAQQFDSLEEDSHRLPDPLRIVFTSNLPDILRPLDISLIVSTYEAGKVFPNLEDGGSTNTHFRKFQKPTGIYAADGRLATGCASTVWTHRDMPSVVHRLEPAGKRDACYRPRTIHVDIHEEIFDSSGELLRISCVLPDIGRQDVARQSRR